MRSTIPTLTAREHFPPVDLTAELEGSIAGHVLAAVEWTVAVNDPQRHTETCTVLRALASLADRAVLVEPLSTVEKAIEIALRLHEPGVETALVLGAGAIGILAAVVLRLRGLSVSLHSLEPEDHPRANLIRDAGIEYLPLMTGCRADGSKVSTTATLTTAMAWACRRPSLRNVPRWLSRSAGKPISTSISSGARSTWRTPR